MWVLLGVVVLLVIGYLILLYNRLIRYRNRVDNAWHQIDVQLNRRADLIPNLVETVKGYAAHEKSTFEMVTKARAALMSAGTVAESAKAEGMVSEALKSLFAVAENYPELKANQNFLALQDELAGTENKIAYSRQFYNDSLMAYNTARQKFPANVLYGSRTFGEQRDYFEPETPAYKEVPKVEFS